MTPPPPSPYVLQAHAFEGPSRHFPRRAVLARLDRAALAAVFENHPVLTPQASGRLRNVLLSGIRRLSRATFSDGFEKLIEPGQPLRMMRLIAALCVEIQHLNEEKVEDWLVATSGQGPADSILFACEIDEVGLCAVGTACEILIGAVTTPRGQWAAHKAMRGKHAENFRIVASTHALNVGMRMITEMAERHGIATLRSADGRPQVQIGEGRHQHHNYNIMTDATPELGGSIADSKQLTSLMLARLGLPVPENAFVRSADETVAAARRIGFPVVVKPDRSSQGRGVTVGVTSDEDARAAFEAARRFGPDVLVERFVAGQDHRLLVVGGRLIAASQRVAAHVFGDGRSTVAQLIDQRNTEPNRRPKGFDTRIRISVDEEVHRVLADEGMTLQSIPGEGVRVDLRYTANLSTGGDAVEVLDRVHPDNRAMAELIARATGIDIIGIDFLTNDVSVPFHAAPCAINEINTQPGLDPHGDPQPLSDLVSNAILKLLTPDGPPPAMPLALVFGTDEAATTASSLHALMLARGYMPARATREGLAVGEVTVSREPMRGDRAAARALLHHPRADCGILTIDPGALRSHGVGLDRWDVLVLACPADAASLGDAAALAAAVSCPIVARADHAGPDSPLPRERLVVVEGTAGEDTTQRLARAAAALLPDPPGKPGDVA